MLSSTKINIRKKNKTEVLLNRQWAGGRGLEAVCGLARGQAHVGGSGRVAGSATSQ